MKKFVILCFIIALFPIVNAVCLIPNENAEINANSIVCSGAYNIENGIKVVNDSIVVDCNNSALIGNGLGFGILLEDRQNVIVKNCNVSNYEIGIYLDNSNSSILKNNYLTKNKFGIALFNSFNNNFEDNFIAENFGNNTIAYLPTSFVQEKKPEAEAEKEEMLNPNQIMEEVIRIKKPFLKDYDISKEVNLILDRYFNITQQNLEISRTFSYNQSDRSTRIILHIKPKKVLLNVSIYEKIPKCVSIYINQILLETAGYEVVQSDPLILWTFSKLDEDKELSYKAFKSIEEDCKKLLFAFGIAAGFEPKEEKKEHGKRSSAQNYLLILAIIFAAASALYLATRAKNKS